ncbi:proton-conducting transporter membrane subunit [Halorhabdus sp. BNX81]|uniref:complex I subunit 5 family protein n=1 Tax=Halorhabdus sp. BNX81 TaxID=2980181 RepID=UPI0023DD4143|nr:proton-conducting transporter membrane subunit [Halorhabdus sp. BNX81]WEL21090.1 Multisubunit Na /H antiporter, MnhD subunit [Halorhabdus sp. BNX81]
MALAHVVVAPLVITLATAILTLLTRRYGRLQRAISLLGIGGYVLAVGAIASRVFSIDVLTGASGETTTLTYQLSDWGAPFGISLVADALSAFMLVLAAIVSVAALVFSARYVTEYGQRVAYHSLFHFMLTGVTGAFLTGDIFNLFVWFEVMLMPSYVLVVFYGRSEHTRAALQYTVLNLLGSALMLVAIGGLYATTGTLNMADMSRRLTHASQYGIDPAPVLGLSGILLAVFALKAGIVPFQFWVPAAYKAAPAPISAMLAGVTKKVGVYAIVRLVFTVLGGASLDSALGLGLSGSAFSDFLGPVLFIMAVGSIFVGGLGAVSRNDLDGVLAYSSIGQVGFIVLAIALAAGTEGPIRTVSLIAVLVYSLNHAIAKSLLFLISGVIQESVGSTRFSAVGGLAARRPILAGSFFLGALAMIGIPPLTGFFGKLLVFDSAGRALEAGVPFAELALGAALLGAILTIIYMSRAWSQVFWGSQTEPVAHAYRPTTLVAIVAGFSLLVVALGVGFDPVYRVAETAAHAAIDHAGYVDAVGPEVGQ